MGPLDILRSIRLFGGVLDAAQLDKLAARGVAKDFPKKAVLMREGDLGASMFAIVSGKVAVSVRERDGETRVAVLGPGDIVGEMSLFTGARRSATVTALKAVSVLEVGKEALDAVLADEPDLIRRFAEVMEQRESELKSIHAEAARWNEVGLSRNEIAVLMTAYYVG
jgi:CRP/FNR family cyclic AMP-dependent transcriptional regulator